MPASTNTIKNIKFWLYLLCCTAINKSSDQNEAEDQNDPDEVPISAFDLTIAELSKKIIMQIK